MGQRSPAKIRRSSVKSSERAEGPGRGVVDRTLHPGGLGGVRARAGRGVEQLLLRLGRVLSAGCLPADMPCSATPRRNTQRTGRARSPRKTSDRCPSLKRRSRPIRTTHHRPSRHRVCTQPLDAEAEYFLKSRACRQMQMST